MCPDICDKYGTENVRQFKQGKEMGRAYGPDRQTPTQVDGTGLCHEINIKI